MCGICGWFDTQGKPADLTAVARMSARLERRGPDHVGSFADGPVALGHRRLSILDLTYRGAQPMVDRERGLALVFNGTIYNHPELRARLQGLGYRFASNGDTEVILNGYAHWGADVVNHLDGMFAFAIWDMREQKLMLARDRIGIKPLYYTDDTGPLRFASTIPALLQGGGINTDLNPAALHHQFTLHGVVPAPDTVLQGIKKLPPAHTLIIDAAGKKTCTRYWQIQTKVDDRIDQATAKEMVESALVEAVKKRMAISDVPVGVLLSGGLDSSLLVALASENGFKPKSFTIGFEDQPEEKGNEFEYSDLVAERYQTEHYRFHIPNDQVLSRLPEAVGEMSEPMFGQDAVAFYLLSEQVSREVKVVLSGQGADEVFAGYFWYPKMAEQFAQCGDEIQSFAPFYFDRSHEELMSMVTRRFRGPDVTSQRVKQGLGDSKDGPFTNRVLGFDISTLIVDDPVKRVDNMTMAWGLEARVPFLDTKLVETAMRIPPEFKLDQGGKGVLKNLARSRIPDAVIDRPKGYFPVPALKFVRGPFLQFMREILTGDSARARGLFEPAYVNRLLANPDQHFTRLVGAKVWHLALFELWLQEHGISA
ncbi:MAG TPA: N-acetylglutaminylglutamine amidotransferase [Halothiobacillaceae bacterium]|nr:N-acetylglutaminylglutamine amidotransferase [Halothiobacillaceae bacterium]